MIFIQPCVGSAVEIGVAELVDSILAGQAKLPLQIMAKHGLQYCTTCKNVHFRIFACPAKSESTNSATPISTALPTILDVVRKDWPTLTHVPYGLLASWMDLFITASYDCLVATTTAPFTRLFMVQKVLLAAPVRGGKNRMDANEKMLRNRFARWKAGYHSQVWRDVVAAYSKQAHRNTRRTEETSELPPSTLRRVKSLIEGGQLSRACQRLSSRGIAALTPQNTLKIAALFPPAAPIAKESVLHPEGTPWNIEPTDVIKAIEQEPDGRAPGPCGLHAEILKDAVRHPDRRLAEEFVAALVLLFNKMGNGELPLEVRTLFCAGNLVPCNKKDGGIRPIVGVYFNQPMQQSPPYANGRRDLLNSTATSSSHRPER